MKFREVSLGEEAVEYVRARLHTGRTLSRYLLDIVPLDAGSVSTLLPLDVTDEDARDFSAGGKLPRRRSEAKIITLPTGQRWLAEPSPSMEVKIAALVKLFLNAGERRLCVFEEGLGVASDPWIRTKGLPFLTSDDEVYWVLRPSSAQAEVESTVAVVNNPHPPLLGVLSSLPTADDWLQVSNQLGDHEFTLLAENAGCLIVGAYDAEGFLFWARSQEDARKIGLAAL